MSIAQQETEASAASRWLSQLFDAQVDSVFTVAFRIVWSRADAEDVVQATFLRAATKQDQLRDHTRVRPWLLQIAYREAIAVLRRRRDVPTDPAAMPERPVVGACPLEAALAGDLAARVAVALAALVPVERDAVVLRDVEDLSIKDVADVLGVGESAAKMRVHRGRQSLRVLLREEVGHGL